MIRAMLVVLVIGLGIGAVALSLAAIFLPVRHGIDRFVFLGLAFVAMLGAKVLADEWARME